MSVSSAGLAEKLVDGFDVGTAQRETGCVKPDTAGTVAGNHLAGGLGAAYAVKGGRIFILFDGFLLDSHIVWIVGTARFGGIVSGRRRVALLTKKMTDDGRVVGVSFTHEKGVVWGHLDVAECSVERKARCEDDVANDVMEMENESYPGGAKESFSEVKWCIDLSPAPPAFSERWQST
jgi:hypothetical protein